MEVRVVGTGPSGLMAAEVLAQAGLAVTIIDHHRSPGRKFLLAGRGGLNLTHSEPLEQFLDRYGAGRPLLELAIRAFPPTVLREWCAGLGIETFVGSTGRVFPVGLKASPLLRAWLTRLAGLGVTLQSREAWTGFDDVPTVLALGGASWPELGSDAGWVKIFADAGVVVNPLMPSNGRQLVKWSNHFASRFAGEPLKNIAVTVAGRTLRGEAMITRDGIEGSVIYALSQQFRESRAFSIDLKPDLVPARLAERMALPRGKQSRSTHLRKAIGLSAVGASMMREGGSENPKAVTLAALGPADITRAISTAGGVAASEVDEAFRLRKYPNTCVVGEMLDWDAPTGGYLLQACFSTAHVASKAMAERLRR